MTQPNGQADDMADKLQQQLSETRLELAARAPGAQPTIEVAAE